MKNSLLVGVILFLSHITFAALSPGDIAFVQYNADGTDDFAFVALVDIPENEVIKFTDNGWKADDTFKTNEGIITWTSPAGGITAGEVVTITMTPTATKGTVSKTGGLNFLATGDQIIAYQGTDAMITALNNEGSGVWQTDSPNTSESKLPKGLTNGTDAVALDEIDNTKYNGSVTTGTKAEILAAINNKANWVGDNTNHQTYSGAFVLPIDLVFFDAFAKNAKTILTWETASETNNDYFTIERSRDGFRFETLGNVDGAGNSFSSIKYNYVDQAPRLGINYYRLKQTDFDGKTESFDLVAVNFQNKHDNLQVIPAQVLDNLTLHLKPMDRAGRVTIFNLVGQRVYNATIEAGSSAIDIDASSFARGQYVARVANGNMVETVRFIKQ